RAARFTSCGSKEICRVLLLLRRESFSTSSLLAHCGGGRDKPGCLGPSAKLPRRFFSLLLSLNFEFLFSVCISGFGRWLGRRRQSRSQLFLPRASPARTPPLNSLRSNGPPARPSGENHRPAALPSANYIPSSRTPGCGTHFAVPGPAHHTIQPPQHRR